jgi:hypothetical protein
VNFYVPLTTIGGTSALFMESSPGAEDWHPIVGNYAKVVKHFAGAVCTHWTAENKTGLTRVSLDFRLIAGPMFAALKCGGGEPKGQIDVYRQTPGYYSCCRRVAAVDTTKLSGSACRSGSVGVSAARTAMPAAVEWAREGPFLAPDARIGFPWTVKNWEKHLRKSEKRRTEGTLNSTGLASPSTV